MTQDDCNGLQQKVFYIVTSALMGASYPALQVSREDPYIKVALRWRFDIFVVCVCLAASFDNKQL